VQPIKLNCIIERVVFMDYLLVVFVF